MIEWEVGDGGDRLRVVDADNVELAVDGDVTVEGPGPDISRPVDETVEATARSLRFPHAVVYAAPLGRDERRELDPSGDPLSLPPGEYVVDVDTEIKTYLRFSGAATIRKTDDFANVVVSFPERRRVILGFRGRHEFPAGTITVPETPAGLAAGLSQLSSSIKTDGPERSYGSLRGHPPLLELGDELSVPEAIARDDSNAGVELIVPPAYDALFVTAPLAYYLRATVRTDDREAPLLRSPEAGLAYDLSPLPALERDVERLLRQVFFLDCLVRNVGPYGTDLAELRLLDALALDADALYEAPPRERLATYLDVPYAAIGHRLPDWHLAMYVAPGPDNVETLPFLLDRLGLLYRPRTSELEGTELVERSLDDFYRGPPGPGAANGRDRSPAPDRSATAGERAGAGQVPSVEIVKPDLRHGRVHGWLADGVPIDVFTSAPAAYDNRLEFLKRSRDDDGRRIVVILNDPDMAGERANVARIYRQRSEELTIDVTVEESVNAAALARVFERDTDFVHYIGHCETGGLRCPDGPLSASTLDRVRAQTFFLNACGSFYEGQSLIRNGSVAGAVTFSQVLNDHAVKVGSTFAKLLVYGFSIERAMRLARRRIMMGKDYAVVGDGTHTLTQCEKRMPTTAEVERVDDEFVLTLDSFSTREIGAYYFPHVEGNEDAYLCGTESSFALDRDELVAFLRETETPVIYDGDVYWSQELWPELER